MLSVPLRSPPMLSQNPFTSRILQPQGNQHNRCRPIFRPQRTHWAHEKPFVAAYTGMSILHCFFQHYGPLVKIAHCLKKPLPTSCSKPMLNQNAAYPLTPVPKPLALQAFGDYSHRSKNLQQNDNFGRTNVRTDRGFWPVGKPLFLQPFGAPEFAC